MQAASPGAPKRRLRQRSRLLVHGIETAPAAEQTETGSDARRLARRMQADRQSTVIADVRTEACPGLKCPKWTVCLPLPQHCFLFFTQPQRLSRNHTLVRVTPIKRLRVK